MTRKPRMAQHNKAPAFGVCLARNLRCTSSIILQPGHQPQIMGALV